MMKSFLLVDLDDTLLVNPLKEFMPAYISALSRALSVYVDPQKMVTRLLFATERMIENNNPEKTLEQVFDENFYPALGLEKNDLRDTLIDFYAQPFNQLQRHTSVVPDARDFIVRAKETGSTIVVATNPLFPQSAMQARLQWAGFHDHAVLFSLVTSYEGMHFAKPNPAYFAEIMGLHGWPQVPAGMVGNSLKDDILPAAKMGLPGFWVSKENEDPQKLTVRGSMAGNLEQASAWLETLAQQALRIPIDKTETILAIFRSSIAVLKTITSKMSDDDWKLRNKQDGSSVLESVSHLFDVEKEINQPRISRFLEQDNPFIAGVDSDAWKIERDYQNTRSPDDLQHFIDRRVENLEILSSLDEVDWHRRAQHSFFGPTTLVEQIGFAALHDMNHIREIHTFASEIQKSQL